MRLRWKVFFILAAVSLLPILAGFLLVQRTTGRVQERVDAEVRLRLHESARERLEQDVRQASLAVLRGKVALQMGLEFLAAEAGDALEREPPSPGRILTPTDFENPDTRPTDTAPREGYVRLDEDGRAEPLDVSLTEQVFLFSPGVDRTAAEQDTARLSSLLPVCQEVFHSLAPMAYRVSLILDSGVTAIFPGSNGYPENFDPRQTSWYHKARQGSGEPAWSELLVSRSSGGLFFAVTIPLVRAGRIAGVAAVEVPVSWFLQEGQLTELWSEEMRSFLVRAEDRVLDDGQTVTGLRVLAKKGYKEKARTLPGGDYEWIDPVDDPHWPVLAASVVAGKAGSVAMSYDGRPSLWAFAPQTREVGFLLVVPEETAMTLAAELRGMVDDASSAQRRQLLGVAAMVLVASLLVALLVAGSFTRAVRVMAVAWQRLARGDFSVRLDMRTGDERDRLVEAFNDTVPRLEEQVRLRHSLELARQVQQSLLPERMPRIPGLDVAGKSLFCQEIGGDSLDFFRLGRQGRLAVVVGDVSGHGAGAALLMATVRAMVRTAAARRDTPENRVALVNRLLCMDVVESGRFVTLFYLEVDVGARRVTWVRAGHEPALLYDPEADSFEELRGEGPALGFLPDAAFSAQEHAFADPGLVLAVGTDGIWEARSPEGEPFGKERYQQAIRANAHKSASDLVDAVLAELGAFTQAGECGDDVTLAVVKRILQE